MWRAKTKAQGSSRQGAKRFALKVQPAALFKTVNILKGCVAHFLERTMLTTHSLSMEGIVEDNLDYKSRLREGEK